MTEEQQDPEFENWAKKCKLGSLNSLTNSQLYQHRTLTVQDYISRFRRGKIRGVLPEAAKLMTVEEALKQKIVDGVNIRKLMLDNRDKFRK
ncbi:MULTISPECIES: hypothetical protein [Spirulina sp. CCY15215]|uniref:hypothetical protein n=1 Tax=Spirulina sp. CCY15215 TaxID=2767591 RepID=UPI001950AB65|nr:hypothetical protein [Spirulina major]